MSNKENLPKVGLDLTALHKMCQRRIEVLDSQFSEVYLIKIHEQWI